MSTNDLPAIRPLPLEELVQRIREVDAALVKLLRAIPAEDWHRPAVKSWQVRDVAAHLLDGSLRRLSLDRDGLTPEPGGPIESYEDLVAFLDGLNADWVKAARRLSPAVLTALLESANTEVADYFAGLDPQAEATFSVSWAGEDSSKVWLDVARELTEKWHHQQQIRDAVARPGLGDGLYLEPILSTFVRCLRRAYAEEVAAPGTAVVVEIVDLSGLAWTLAREEDGWELREGVAPEPAARIALDSDSAWRFWCKGLDGEELRRRAETSGPRHLLEPFFRSLAVMG